MKGRLLPPCATPPEAPPAARQGAGGFMPGQVASFVAFPSSRQHCRPTARFSLTAMCHQPAPHPPGPLAPGPRPPRPSPTAQREPALMRGRRGHTAASCAWQLLPERCLRARPKGRCARRLHGAQQPAALRRRRRALQQQPNPAGVPQIRHLLRRHPEPTPWQPRTPAMGVTVQCKAKG